MWPHPKMTGHIFRIRDRNKQTLIHFPLVMEGGHTQQIPSLKLTNRTWKSLVGRWMSFFDKMHKSNCRYFVLVCGFGLRCGHGAAGLCIQARWLTTPAGCRCRGSWVACQLHYFCFHKLREAKRRQSRSRGLSDGGILLEPVVPSAGGFCRGATAVVFFWLGTIWPLWGIYMGCLDVAKFALKGAQSMAQSRRQGDIFVPDPTIAWNILRPADPIWPIWSSVL